jgi:outer membrane protein assembly factor BamE (lipoprotein component of BamABCDE complex)
MDKEELSLLFTSIIQRTADLSVGSKNMENCIKKARIVLGVLLAKDKLKNLQLGITRDNDTIVWFDNISREILFQFDL